MTLDGAFYRFQAGALVPCQDEVDEVRLAAADSWLVDDGRVRNLGWHFERFTNWVTATDAVAAGSLPQFFESVVQSLPLTGRWFPRIELHLEAHGGSELYLRLRKAPEPAHEIVLWTYPDPDPRANPTVKGPDLSLGMQLRRKAIVHGADEAVLLDADGHIVEGALASIVWWNNDVLCAPDDRTSWLPSVTRREVFDIAHQAGFSTRVEHVKPADLIGFEIWALSSLHGIRPVVDWLNLGGPVGPTKHLDSFEKRLRLLGRQIR
ncbi:MAG: aminotransferase class IV [Micrococcales bacterium]